MKNETLMEALVQVKRIGNLQHEILDISQQMAEAVDRDDEVATGMLISMRSEPIEKLRISKYALQTMLDSLKDTEDGERLSALFSGGGTAQDVAEEALTKQVAANARESERILALERILNRKISRDQSIFQ